MKSKGELHSWRAQGGPRGPGRAWPCKAGVGAGVREGSRGGCARHPPRDLPSVRPPPASASPASCEPDMISTRVMDIKLREAAEGLGEDGSGKKKSKFKTFKKFFGKKKRKESPSSTGKSTWKESPAKSEVIAAEEAGPVGYDSEDELEESRGTLGSRALSHDSIFIPESGQDPARPVRVFSQENVCDRIKALQLKIQCGVRLGPPPAGVLPLKRADDAGMSSEDDGLPRSPPELSLLPDAGPGVTIKVSLVSSSRPQTPEHASDAGASPRTSDGSLAPVADFRHPPESSSCLDNSAAKHKLLVKPRHQRSKMRRLSSRAQSESLSDLICTLEEEESEEKSPKVSGEESPSRARPELMALGEEPGGPALPPPGGARARRARLQHSPALSASVEDGLSPGDDPARSPETPGVPEPPVAPTLCRQSPTPPDSPRRPPSPDRAGPEEELPPAGPCPPAEVTAGNAAPEATCAPGDEGGPPSVITPEEGDTGPPEAMVTTDLDTASAPDGPGQGVQTEAELRQVAPGPEETEPELPAALAPSPAVPRSCLKPRAVESRPGEASTEAPDREAEQVGPERPAPPRRGGRGGGEPRANRRLLVTSGRARARPGSRAQGPSRARLPLLRGSPPWKSEAALDDLQPPPQPEPARPAQGGSQEPGCPAADQAAPDRSPQGPATAPGPGEPCPAAQEASPREDRSPFPVKLRSTSVSLTYREGAAREARGVKRYSAEMRLERGLTLPPQDEPRPLGAAPTPPGSKCPSGQAKGKARPPLPRKPLLPSLTLPHPPAAAEAGPAEPEKVAPDPGRQSRAERKQSPRGAATGPGANGPPTPPWITMARQKRRGAPEQPANQEDRPGAQLLRPETEQPAKAPERAQEPRKQADFVRSKSFLMTPAKPSVTQRQGAKLSLKEGLQRGISLSHQNLAAQSAAMTEKELHQLKRASYASSDQPSWMELARKKSQAWSDMPQIIK